MKFNFVALLALMPLAAEAGQATTDRRRRRVQGMAVSAHTHHDRHQRRLFWSRGGLRKNDYIMDWRRMGHPTTMAPTNPQTMAPTTSSTMAPILPQTLAPVATPAPTPTTAEETEKPVSTDTQATSAPSSACNQLECCSDADCGDAQSYECRENTCLLRECDISLGTVECCVNTDCLDANEICEESVCIKTGNPRFTLSWFGDDDLDLHVITPGGVEIYYDYEVDDISGGILDEDDIPDITQRWVENIVFDANAPTGNYTYFVVGFNTYGAPDNYDLSVWEGNTQIAFVTGGGLQGGGLGFEEESTRYTYTKT